MALRDTQIQEEEAQRATKANKEGGNCKLCLKSNTSAQCDKK